MDEQERIRERNEHRWAIASVERLVFWLIVCFVFFVGYVCGGAHLFG